MKPYTLHELKKELSAMAPAKVLELCLRLAKHKAENKQLLAYLVFEAENEDAFIEKVKKQADVFFRDINKKNLYLAKKGLRKILRVINLNIKFSGSKRTEMELLIYFCSKMKNSGIPVNKSKLLINLYQQQLKRMNKALVLLHEDLQNDYRQELQQLDLNLQDYT